MRYLRFVPAAVGLIVVLLMVVLTAEFQFLSYKKFLFSAYDTALQFNEIWKFFFGEDNFNSIRGLSIFGDHLWMILAYFGPAFWFQDPERVLFYIQSFALYSGALFLLFWRGISNTSRSLLGLFLCIVFLINPFYAHTALDQFHMEVVGGFFIFGMLFSYFRGALKWACIFAGFALICREDMAIPVGAFGLSVWIFRPEKKFGLSLFLLSIGYFFLALNVLMPLFSDAGFFRHEPGFVMHEFTIRYLDWKFYYEILTDSRVHTYFLFLIAPFIFIHPKTYFLIIPFMAMTSINIVSRSPYLIQGTYHYDYHNLPFLFAAVAVSLDRWGMPLMRSAFLGATLVLSIAVSSLHGASAWRRLLNPHFFSLEENGYVELEGYKKKYLSSVGLSVASTHWASPNLAFRQKVYFLPNPFVNFYYGVRGKSENSNFPDILIIDNSDLDSLRRVEPYLSKYKLLEKGQKFQIYRLVSKSKVE